MPRMKSGPLLMFLAGGLLILAGAIGLLSGKGFGATFLACGVVFLILGAALSKKQDS